MLRSILTRFRSSPGIVQRRSASQIYELVRRRAEHPASSQALGLASTDPAHPAWKFPTWWGSMVLHVWLSMRRLRSEGERGRAINQLVFDAFWGEVDLEVVRAGVSTLVLARRVRDLIPAFYGACIALDKGLAGTEEELSGALMRNVYVGEDVDDAVVQMGMGYVKREVEELDKVETGDSLVAIFRRWE